MPYNNTREDARRAVAEGLPSLLPDSNPWKRAGELHRWGYHSNGCPASCPVPYVHTGFEAGAL